MAYRVMPSKSYGRSDPRDWREGWHREGEGRHGRAVVHVGLHAAGAAFAVTAHIVMAYVVTAYTGMVYIVLACKKV